MRKRAFRFKSAAAAAAYCEILIAGCYRFEVDATGNGHHVDVITPFELHHQDFPLAGDLLK